MYDQIASNKRKSALLLCLFFLVIIGIGYWANYYFANGQSIFVISIIIAIAMSLFSYYKGDSVALAVAKAKQITEADNAYLYHIVENLCITIGIPMPKVYLINDPALNAFATGRDPQHASIAFTTGIVNALENEELEGVAAHELSHIKNYDIRLMTVVIICVGVIALLADFMTRGMFWGGMRGRGDRERGNLGAALAIVGLILIILSPIISQLIQFAISRKREFLADASGSLITRYPEGLARALEKISAGPPLQHVNRATAHLYIANPFKSDTMKSVANLFSTHPPIAERIRRLRETT